MTSTPDQNPSRPKSFDLPMSPLTRLGMAFGLELSLDNKATVFTEETEKLYLERQKEAEARRDGTFKLAFYIDAALAFVIAGGGFSIPIIGINTSEISALVPLLLIASAFAFFIASNSFVTWAAYDSVNSNIAKRRCDPHGIDPEFLIASRIHTELSHKLFRPKFNIWGEDFYEPNKAFKIFSRVLFLSFNIIFLSFPVLHYSILYYGASNVLSSSMNWFFQSLVISFAAVASVASAMITIGAYTSFRFTIKAT